MKMKTRIRYNFHQLIDLLRVAGKSNNKTRTGANYQNII